MNVDQLSLVFSALADPTRRAILAALALGPQTVGDIAKPFDITEPAVIKHLKTLERAGLVTVERRGTARPRSLQASPLREAFDWMANYRQFWDASFNRLDDLLEDLQRETS